MNRHGFTVHYKRLVFHKFIVVFLYYSPQCASVTWHSITIWELGAQETGKEHADTLAAAVAMSFNNVLCP